MAAHAAPKKRRKGLRVGVGVAVTVATLFFGPLAAQVAFADEAPAASSTPAPAAPSQPATPTTGTAASDQQQKPADTPTASTTQAPAPSDSSTEAPKASSTPTPAPAPSPAPAPAAPASPTPAAAPSPSPSPSASPAPQPAAKASLQTAPAPAPTVESLPVLDTPTIYVQPASYCEGEVFTFTSPQVTTVGGVPTLPGYTINTLQLNGQDVTLADFLANAHGVAGQTVSFNVDLGADAQHQLPPGVTSWGWSGTLAPPTHPDDPTCQPTPTTVDNPTIHYTFDPATGGTSYVVTGGNTDQPLTKPIYVRAAAWTYDQPASGSPSWSQTLDGYTDLVIDKIGTFSVEPPQLEGCRQYDVYASYKGFDALALPNKLLGPNNPYEPAFVSTVLAGDGPSPTYSYTSSEGCNTPPPPIQVTPTGPEVPPLVCGQPGTWTLPANTPGLTYSKDGNVETATLNNSSVNASQPKFVFGPLPEGWVLSEDGNSATYTVVFPPVSCPPQQGSDITRGATDCTTHTTVVTTNAWTQSSSWNGESYTYGDKVYTKTETTVAQNDAEKATCPIAVVIQHPSQNQPVQTVSEAPTSQRLASTGSDIDGLIGWGIAFVVLGGIAMAARWLRRKPAASK